MLQNQFHIYKLSHEFCTEGNRNIVCWIKYPYVDVAAGFNLLMKHSDILLALYLLRGNIKYQHDVTHLEKPFLGHMKR